MSTENVNPVMDSAAETAASGTEPDPLLAALGERDRLAAENAELQHQLLRGRADYDNLRRRSSQERTESEDRASRRNLEVLLPIVDDFERALGAACADGPEREYAKGMDLIYQRLADALRQIGLEPMDSRGQQFDPEIHEAVDRVPGGEAAPDTVVEEFRRGYLFRGKLLRAAMVRVAVPAEPSDPSL